MKENNKWSIHGISVKSLIGIILTIIGVYLMMQGSLSLWLVGLFLAAVASFLLNFWLFLIILIISVFVILGFHDNFGHLLS